MYISTRGNCEMLSSSQVIRLGMVPRGGLFVPQEIPRISQREINSLQGKSYQDLACHIFSLYLSDFTTEEIQNAVTYAYNDDNFDHKHITPLYRLNEQTYFLELWHGPTAAFKDIALQIMPFLLKNAVTNLKIEKEIIILVATSGDTGKAALEGFKNISGFRVGVFYPHGGVSKIQERQMTTTDGDNTFVIGVRGNFDDCQNAVKKIFGQSDFVDHLAKEGYELSSANSINWGRLLPQIVYYFWSYLHLLKNKEIAPGEEINFVIPTGNFGNILAGYYAWMMGLPIDKLICASNENKVLTEFFHSGVYNGKRDLVLTRSPSMDILISSNLERFLFEICNRDAEKIDNWMTELQQKGTFSVDKFVKQSIEEKIFADFASEEEALEAIKEVFSSYGYVIDPHTAVGYKVYQKYLSTSKSQTKTVIASTASPFKFCSSVLEALEGKDYNVDNNEFDMLKELSSISQTPVHPALSDLNQKQVIHDKVCDKEDIKVQLQKILL